MTTSLVNAESMLAIDVGTVSTRASLFDVVDGRYRFVASAGVPTTVGVPFNNVGEGVRMALDQLQGIIGRPLIDSHEQLVIPTAPDGSGVDQFVVTLSAGPPLKVVAVGLLDDVSLESAKHLAMTTYARVVQTIGLNDKRKPDARINAIVRLRPDLIIIAGGTENGASQSVLKLLEAVGLACYLLPQNQRPDVLFVGNSALQDEVKSAMQGVANLHLAPNIRPSLETESLDAAQAQMGKVYGQVRARQIPGVEELNQWSGGRLLTTSAALGRTVRFVSKAHSTRKGVLGVDVGASATTVAAAFAGNLVLGVYPQLGLGSGLIDFLDESALGGITRWLTVEVTDGYVREYILNKSLHPGSVPATVEDLQIEQAITRQVLQSAIKIATRGFPAQVLSQSGGLLPWVEPILATGSVLAQAPTLAQSVLMLLDGLQPAGVTTLVLDQNHIASALGAAAAVNPLLAVQALESSSFVHLGTVISPVGFSHSGTPVLQLKLTYQSGHETSLEVKQGALEVLPLPQGQTARLQLQPLHRYDVGMGAPGRGGSLRVMGGALGILIDARGRPLLLPEEDHARRELLRTWLSALGG